MTSLGGRGLHARGESIVSGGSLSKSATLSSHGNLIYSLGFCGVWVLVWLLLKAKNHWI